MQMLYMRLMMMGLSKNWNLLEGLRYVKKQSFDFIIQSIGIYTNIELLLLSCKIMLDKLQDLDNIIEKDELEIKNADNTLANSFDIILEGEDYTIGKVIEYFLLVKFYETGMLTYCGFKMLHPHDTYSIIRIGYKQAVEISSIKGHLKECILDAVEVYTKLRKEFLKLTPR